MREIKFRLIREDRIVGYEFHYQGEIPSGMTLISEGDHHRHGVYHAKVGDSVFVDISDGLYNLILHDHKDQFVGLPDENGVEIYEWDVLQYGEDGSIREIVEWKENMWTEEGFMTGFGEFCFTLDQYKIIGNRWENPELFREE